MSECVTIDGSYGEGGGQVIRTSVSMAAITGKTVEIANVRAKRSRPGLQPQHLMAVRAAGEICGASVSGAHAGSTWFHFEPGHGARPGSYRFDIGTAGSTVLVAQTVLLPLALAEGPSEITITGGTHNDHAPCTDYLATVYLPALARMGLHVTLDVSRVGFYPAGGGEIRLQVEGSTRLRAFEAVTRGSLREIVARVVASDSLRPDIVKRGHAALEYWFGKYADAVVVEDVAKPSLGPGVASFIGVQYEHGLAGFTGLGARGKRMEEVVREGTDALAVWSAREEAVDEHLADQLVLPSVFAHGTSRWTTPVVTEHLRTVAWVSGHFTQRQVEIVEREDGSGEASVLPSA